MTAQRLVISAYAARDARDHADGLDRVAVLDYCGCRHWDPIGMTTAVNLGEVRRLVQRTQGAVEGVTRTAREPAVTNAAA